MFWSSLLEVLMQSTLEILAVGSLILSGSLLVFLGRAHRQHRALLRSLHATREELGQIETGLRQERAERQHLQTELRKTELRYHTLLERMNEGMVIVDNDGVIQFANDRYCELLGYARDELVGRNERELVPSDGDREMLNLKQELRQQGVHDQYEIQVCQKSGDRMWWLISGAPMRDLEGNVIGSIGVQTDVTAYKRAEEALRLSEQKYRTLVEQIPAVTYISQLHPDLAILSHSYISPQIETLLGIPRTDWQADPKRWNQHLHPQDRDRVWTTLLDHWHRQAPMIQEYRLLTHDQQFIWVRDEAVIVCNSEGQPLFLQGVMVDITDRKRMEEELRASEQNYRTLIERMNEGIVVVDTHGVIQFVNDRYCDMLGYHREELLGRNERELTATDRDRQMVESKNSLRQQGIYDQYEIQVQTKAGHLRWWLISGTPLYDAQGNLTGSMGILTDITERKQAEEALKQAEEKYRSIFENAAEGIFQMAPDGRILSANPALARILGYESAEELITEVTDLQNLFVDTQQRAKLTYRVQQQQAIVDFESQMYRKDGTIIWIAENIRTVRHLNGGLLYYEGSIKDITQRRRAEEQLLYNAFYDPLSGLANRALFMDRLNHALIQTHFHPESWFAILCIDLDRFKVVNDSLGHRVGDQLLVETARRLENCLTPEDLVARLSGDEFAVLLESPETLVDITRIVERIQASLIVPFHLNDHEVFITASIGIALSHHNSAGQPYDRAEDLMRDADTAMYRAKYMGKACYKIFDRTMHTNTITRLRLESDLRRAIERQEIQLHYQPIINLVTEQLTGFEVLCRWHHPTRGLLYPGLFIPVAEETGLIMSMGEWVLREASQQLRQWQQQGLAPLDLTVSVNVAGKQFSQPDLVDQIQQVLADTQLNSYNLSLEIAEDVIMENIDSAASKLHQIRDLGVRLCIDDFGTGYSSLSRLHHFPIDTLKIDCSFVSQLGIKAENREIVHTIINLARNLGMSVVAEGIETPSQLNQLQAMGCDFGQGYLFAIALDRSSAADLLNRYSTPHPGETYFSFSNLQG